MSRSVFLIALFFGQPGHASAQATSWRDSVIRLSVAVQALRDSLVDRDSMVTEVSRRGSLVISASSGERELAAKALEYFAELYDRWYGTALPTPAGFRIAIRIQPDRRTGFGRLADPRDRTVREVVLAGLPDTGQSVRIARVSSREELGPALVSAFAEMMFGALSPPLQRWIAVPLPLHQTGPERRSIAMYAVVTSTGQAERGCVAGRIDMCGYALGVRPAPSPQLSGSYPLLDRADLLLITLETGGAGAWARFSAGGPRVDDALAQAAGIPADSLLRRWRDGIMSLRPDRSPIGGGPAFLVAGWSAVLLFGTLGASRWR